MKLHDKTFVKYLSELEIAERVSELADDISVDYQDKEPLIVSVLSGAYIFTADITRSFPFAHELCFVSLKSYDGTTSRGTVNNQFDLALEKAKGREVIILEDIIDSGTTLQWLLKALSSHEPANVEVAALLFKPDAYKYQAKIKYVGFSIPNDFVVGYGMDYLESGRNLKDIYILKP